MALEATCKLCEKDRETVRQLITGKYANICDKCLDVCDKKFKALGEIAARTGAPECDFCAEQSGLVFQSDLLDGRWICLCHGCRRLAREIAMETQAKPKSVAAKPKSSGTWQVGDRLLSTLGLDEGTRQRLEQLSGKGDFDSLSPLFLVYRPLQASGEVVEAAIRYLPSWVGPGYGGPVLLAVLKAAPRNSEVQSHAREWLNLNPVDPFGDRIRRLLGEGKE